MGVCCSEMGFFDLVWMVFVLKFYFSGGNFFLLGWNGLFLTVIYLIYVIGVIFRQGGNC